MKKILFVLCCTLMVGSLTACGAKVECDFCGEEKRCTTKTVWGEEIKYCKDCENELKDYFN